MNESISEAMSAFFDTHCLELSLKRLHFLLSLHDHVISQLTAAVIVRGSVLDSWLKRLRHVIAIDVCEFNLIVVILVFVSGASGNDWLGAQHDWNKYKHNEEEGHTYTVLLFVTRKKNWFNIFSLTLVVTKTEHLGNHDLND